MSADRAIPEHVFRLILDRTAVPFVLIDGDGVIRHASASITPLLGWDPAEELGRNVLEYVDEEHVSLVLEGLAEIEDDADVAAAIPVVLPLRRRDGGRAWVEVAMMPIPGEELIALRLRSWDADHHLAQFMEQLLADAPLPDLLAALARSVTASVYGVAAAVHHGWDGERFVGVAGSWDGAADLPLADGPWVDALDHDGVLVGDGSPRARSQWLVRVGGGTLPPAVLTVWTDITGPPKIGHHDALATAGRYVELAIVRTSEHQRLRHLAGHDPLTGVANRTAFRDHLANALAIGERGLAVAFCDLDGFKQLNDEHGHGAGDDVLVEVADRLRGTLRESDELARMGGDEFTILCRGIGSAAEAEQVGVRLLAAIDRPFAVPAGTATLGISVGVALAGSGATADGLLQAADTALYQSKRAGGRRCTVSG